MPKHNQIEYHGQQVAKGWPERVEAAQSETHCGIGGRDYPRVRLGDEADDWGDARDPKWSSPVRLWVNADICDGKREDAIWQLQRGGESYYSLGLKKPVSSEAEISLFVVRGTNDGVLWRGHAYDFGEFILKGDETRTHDLGFDLPKDINVPEDDGFTPDGIARLANAISQAGRPPELKPPESNARALPQRSGQQIEIPEIPYSTGGLPAFPVALAGAVVAFLGRWTLAKWGRSKLDDFVDAPLRKYTYMAKQSLVWAAGGFIVGLLIGVIL